MPLFNKIEIKDTKNAIVTVGNYNKYIGDIVFNIKEVEETNISSEGATWEEVENKLKSIRKEVSNISDENEDIRDQEIIPSLSKAKKEAEILKQEPTKSKEGFLDSFKSFCESIAKVGSIAVTVAPIIASICQLVGIPVPSIG